MKNRILLIDDDPTLLDLLSQYLANAGYQVFAAPNGSIGLKLAYNEHPDLVLLDVMLPGMDGWEICARLREMTAVPIVMLTAKASEADKLRGFRLGVDDYVTKPFSFAELVARVQAVLARTKSKDGGARNVYAFHHVAIDLDRWSVTRDGEAVSLSPTEFKMLKFLVENKGRAIAEEELLQAVWGLEEGVERGYVRRYI